jgi:hypothetical protein
MVKAAGEMMRVAGEKVKAAERRGKTKTEK